MWISVLMCIKLRVGWNKRNNHNNMHGATIIIKKTGMCSLWMLPRVGGTNRKPLWRVQRFLNNRIKLWPLNNKVNFPLLVRKYVVTICDIAFCINLLNAELNPICYLLALLGAHHFLHVSRIRVKSLTLRQPMSYIYGAPILDVSRSHTTTHHSR